MAIIGSDSTGTSTRQLREELIALKEVLDRSDSLIEDLDRFVQAGNDVDTHLSRIVPSTSAGNRQPHADKAEAAISRANRVARAWDIEHTIVGFRDLISALAPLYKNTRIGKALLADGLLEDTRAVLDAYKEYQEQYSNAATYLLFREAEAFTLRYRDLQHVTASLLAEIGDPGTVTPEQAVLELELPMAPRVGDVTQFLVVVEQLYDIVAVLVVADEPIQPLDIRRIESGTVWYLWVGGRLVIAGLKSLFRVVLNTLTVRGRAETLNEVLEAGLRAGEYAELVAATGGDAGPIIRRIHEAAPEIADKFSALFRDRRGPVYFDGEQFEFEGDPPAQLPRPPRALPPATREYRRRSGGEVWHFCPRCSNWPVEDYESLNEVPEGDRIDGECKSKERRGVCR